MERLFSSPNIVDQEVQPWNFWVNPFRMLKAVEMTNNPRVTKSWKKKDLHYIYIGTADLGKFARDLVYLHISPKSFVF